MFRKIISSMETANAKAAFKRGEVSCPECGAKPGMMPEKWDGVVTCKQCGMKASVSEWAAGAVEGRKTGNADRPPMGTRIRREAAAGSTVWNIPAKGKFGFFMIFAVFWLAITALVSGSFLLSFLTGSDNGSVKPEWFLIPFFGIFWAVGLGMLYAGLREKFMCQSVTVGGGKVTLAKRMFGKESLKSIPVDGRTSVSQKEFYQQNYKPVYGIEIKNESGKLRFGSTLTEEEKAWLVADIARSISGGSQPVATASVAADGLGTIKVAQAKEIFSIPLPGPGKSVVVASSIFAVMGIVFFCIGLFVIGDARTCGGGSGIGSVFSFFEYSFRTIWLIMSGFFALLGISMTVHTFMSMGKDRRIEGSGTTISVRTYKRGIVEKELSFPRGEVIDIRTSQSGSANGRAMKRIELIVGDRAERIADWLECDKADEIVAQMREALGVSR